MLSRTDLLRLPLLNGFAGLASGWRSPADIPLAPIPFKRMYSEMFGYGDTL